MKTWTVKAIDMPARERRLPFWKLTREVQAATRADAIIAARAVLHAGCVVKSVSVKRLALALALLPLLGGCINCHGPRCDQPGDNSLGSVLFPGNGGGLSDAVLVGLQPFAYPPYPTYVAPHYRRPSTCYANDLGGGTVALNCY